MSADGGGLERRVLRSSRLRTTLLLIGSVFALGIGVAAVVGGEKNGWFIVAFGAVCTPFLCLLLLRPNRLELDERGLTTVSPLGKRWSVPWHECGPFRTAVAHVAGNRHASTQVVFECEGRSGRSGGRWPPTWSSEAARRCRTPTGCAPPSWPTCSTGTGPPP